MSTVVPFPDDVPAKSLQRIKAVYTIGEIRSQFGWNEAHIRRWIKEGIIRAIDSSPAGEPCFDFHALEIFRRAREMRSRGRPLRKIELELRGQRNLFPESEGRLIPLPVRMSPFEEALILHEQGDPRASAMYAQAIKEEECAADAFCNLGILDYEAGNIVGAFDHFTKALGQDPRHFESHFNLAHLYFEEGNIRLARLHYEISAVIEPGNASAHFNIGLVNAIEEKIPAAIAALCKAKEFATEEELTQIDEILLGLQNTADNSTEHRFSSLR
ncbi:MAG: tetratricopeptide repeat protein [Acidobacteriota bacterium]|jgi:tetratricopeptide (TPR) repeat protein|nr:tetratricopeptide repeat protein [Acidobacteriota bacterium]